MTPCGYLPLEQSRVIPASGIWVLDAHSLYGSFSLCFFHVAWAASASRAVAADGLQSAKDAVSPIATWCWPRCPFTEPPVMWLSCLCCQHSCCSLLGQPFIFVVSVGRQALTLLLLTWAFPVTPTSHHPEMDGLHAKSTCLHVPCKQSHGFCVSAVFLGSIWFLQTMGSTWAGHGFRDGVWKMVVEQESGHTVKAVRCAGCGQSRGVGPPPRPPEQGCVGWVHTSCTEICISEWPPYSLLRREWLDHSIGWKVLLPVCGGSCCGLHFGHPPPPSPAGLGLESRKDITRVCVVISLASVGSEKLTTAVCSLPRVLGF